MSQHAELKTWILEQTGRGCTPGSLVDAMVTAGYTASFAQAFLVKTLQEGLAAAAQDEDRIAPEAGGAGKADGRSEGDALPRPERVPEPDLLGSPTRLTLPDREVGVLFAMEAPRVVLFEGLLSHEECDGLIESSRARLARSETVDRASGASKVHDARTSEGMFFERGETPLIRRIEARIASLLDWPVHHGEGLQILHYGVGGEYKPHYDYFDPHDPGTPAHLARGGNRVGTLIMYLNTPVRGGGTIFPDLHLEVAPIRGNAVFFSYERAHPASKSLHGGSPVIAGEKWIATKWLRSGVFH